jgi:hypothetical protein
MKFQIKSLVQSAACAVAFTLGAIVPAQSAVIVGTFDPAFSATGLTFTNLGWRGEVRINIADSCLALSAGSFTLAECSTASIVNAFVDLYDTNLPNPFVLDRLDFGGALQINNFTSSLGNLLTLDLSMIEPPGDWVAPQGTLGAPVDQGYKNYFYGLSLQGTLAVLEASSNTLFDFGAPGSPDVRDTTFGCPYDGDFAICASDNTPTVTFVNDPPPNRVPEPQGWLLFAGALVGAGLASRKRRQG